jgi:predicted DNA binding CopG/RHH family protein
MRKKVNFGMGQNPAAAEARLATPDEFVETGSTTVQKTQRLTLDIPVKLHRRLKSKCSGKGLKIRRVVQRLIEQWVDEAT